MSLTFCSYYSGNYIINPISSRHTSHTSSSTAGTKMAMGWNLFFTLFSHLLVSRLFTIYHPFPLLHLYLYSSFVVALTPLNEINALRSLYEVTNGEDWRWRPEILTGPRWSFNNSSQKDPCNTNNKAWQGIICSSTPTKCMVTSCNILQIDLTGYGLYGSLPEDFFSLNSLMVLRLSGNFLTGSIPSVVGNLTNLRNLEIFANRLDGSLPFTLGSLSHLQYLYFNNNLLTGSLPSSIASLDQLVNMYLNDNHLTGTIPSCFQSLSELVDLGIYNNNLTGSIPSSFGSLPNLARFVIFNNRITGSIPPSFGSLTQLLEFWINENDISGSLPSSLGSLSQLLYFVFYDNQITGTIPTSFGLLSHLEDFYALENQLTGSIPSSFGSLSELMHFSIYKNYISGPIPSSFGALTRLELFVVANNQITGSIPSTFGSLIQLDSLYLYDNHITGSLLSSFGFLSQFLYINVYNNFITGSIPSSFGSLSLLFDLGINSNYIYGSIPSTLGSLSSLQYFYIYENDITGPIPASLNDLSNVRELHLHNNRLTGSIPLQLTSFPYLLQLFSQQNHLTGSLGSLIQNANSSTTIIRNLDFSGNRLTGTIPDNIFLPSLESISLSINCFKGKLSPSICNGVNLMVISLDGLGSSGHCPKLTTLPFTGVSLGGMMEGSIPDCIWELSNLETLHLAGNGLRGTIAFSPLNTSAMSKLVDLTLSHNYLSGEIPNWLLGKSDMTTLDLSHNKFTGDLDQSSLSPSRSNDQNYRYDRRSLKLIVNRLSGRSPSSLSMYDSLDILSGNLFGCENIPSNDANREYYTCGSSEYNQSMMALGIIVVALLSLIIFYYLCLFLSQSSFNCHSSLLLLSIRCICEKNVTQFNLLKKYHWYYLQKSLTSASPGIYHFGQTLAATQKMFFISSGVIIICSIPFYIIKDVDGNTYVTHYHQYQWYYTIAYLSGLIPGVMLLVLCLISLSLFRMLLCKFASFPTTNSRKSPEIISQLHSNFADESSSTSTVISESAMVTRSEDYIDWIYLCAISCVNLLIVGAVNGLYIWSTLQNLSNSSRLTIQLCLSLFGILWKVILRMVFPSRVKNSLSGMWLLSFVGVLNGVIIPCVVTSFTSPSCYQRLIVEPDEITLSYNYPSCTAWVVTPEDRTCVSYDNAAMVGLSLIPPFTYSYQCGSTLLTSYIPVYLYSSISQILLTVFIVLLRLLTQDEDHPQLFRLHFFRPHELVHPSKIVSNVVNNIVLLLTFGLSSPVLCFGIGLCGIIDVSCYLILLGRVLYKFEERETDSAITMDRSKHLEEEIGDP